MSDSLIGYLVGIGILIVIGYVLFYPIFEELVNKFWEEIDRIKNKVEEKKDDWF